MEGGAGTFNFDWWSRKHENVKSREPRGMNWIELEQFKSGCRWAANLPTARSQIWEYFSCWSGANWQGRPTYYHITIHLSIRFGPTLPCLFNHLLRNEYLSYCGLLLKRFCGSMGSHRSARFVRTCPNLATDSNSQTQRYLQFRACASSRVRGRKGNINAKSWHKWPAGQCSRLGGELF